MGIVGDGLEQAEAKTATRPIPKGAPAQMRFLVKQMKSTRAVADLLGISQRTVERYVKDQIKTPRPELAARLVGEVRKRWQPRVRERAKKQAATTTGIVVETRARFGFTAAPGSTDDGRIRLITQHLPPEYAARLFEAQAAGATDAELQAVLAEGLQEIYFKDSGRRADGLLVEFTDIDYVELDF
ncbi:XRE family transcriptional regulator [Streptomyces sp. WAC05374]|uniref:telomere-protecting terminal protein Tpg n=1 Tax=Streptomyces sp. WAC05374 TaxID=2487420 RepID=UPI000F881885|nr:XRE family transcriptional regulator [Streptomyces sp. WAC05374]RSS99210.1 XRE family transcriptional regulator [Streptomyces sp. WAC05374]TDF44483.1 XRE family transcriptional regulator [Streptomyces sp. WAC05374]TDF45461.1 XRE family transcriptional regulator [Streptomyces sp. WAC05374]